MLKNDRETRVPGWNQKGQRVGYDIAFTISISTASPRWCPGRNDIPASRQGLAVNNVEGYSNPEIDSLFADGCGRLPLAAREEILQAQNPRRDVPVEWILRAQSDHHPMQRPKPDRPASASTTGSATPGLKSNRDLTGRHTPRALTPGSHLQPIDRIYLFQSITSPSGSRRPSSSLSPCVLILLIRIAAGESALVMAGEAGAGDHSSWPHFSEKFGPHQPLPMHCFSMAKASQPSIPDSRFASIMPVFHSDLQPAATLFLTGPHSRSRFRWHPVRRTGGALCRTWATRNHGTGAVFFLLHAIVLGRTDGDPFVSVAMDWLPSFATIQWARTIPACPRNSTSPPLILPATTHRRLFFMATLCPHELAPQARGLQARFRQDRARQGLSDSVNPAPSVLCARPVSGGHPCCLQAGTLFGGCCSDRDRVSRGPHGPYVLAASAARLKFLLASSSCARRWLLAFNPDHRPGLKPRFIARIAFAS